MLRINFFAATKARSRSSPPPVHAAPLHSGDGLVHVLVFVPPPHDTEQPVQLLHPPSTSPHDAELEPPPEHALPWQLGLGLSQLRVRVFVHALLQPP